MQAFVDSAQGVHRARDISGATEKEILSYLDRGIPVCIWSTVDMLPVANTSGWYIKSGNTYTERYFSWPKNEHCMVLVSYSGDNVTVHDPLKGETFYDREVFFHRYAQVGRYAIVLEPDAG